MYRSFRVLTVAAMLLPCVAPGAQQPAAPPSDLFAAYVRATTAVDSNAGVSVIAGDAPASLRDRLLIPSVVHILGAVGAGRTTLVLGTTPIAPDSVLALLSSAYGRAGYGALSRIAQSSQYGGFRPAPPRVLTQFCHDSTEVITSAARSRDGMTDVRLRINSPSPLCARLPQGPRQPPTARGGPFDLTSSPLPILRDPADASFQAECFASGASGQQGTSTTLFTPMDPAALMQHYGTQLDAQGWTRSTVAAAPAQATWTRRDSSGATQLVTLRISVPPTAPTCREAHLDIVTLRGAGR